MENICERFQKIREYGTLLLLDLPTGGAVLKRLKVTKYCVECSISYLVFEIILPGLAEVRPQVEVQLQL